MMRGQILLVSECGGRVTDFIPEDEDSFVANELERWHDRDDEYRSKDDQLRHYNR